MKIELTEYELIVPSYLPAGSFADTFTGNPLIRKIKFKLPDDSYLTAKREFTLHGFCFSFSELNYFVGGYCETYCELYPGNGLKIYLNYPTNHEHIDGLKRDLESHKNKVKELTKIIKKLEKIK